MNKLFRYAGSKTKYLPAILPLIDSSKTFIEPFLGSGAVLLNVSNKHKIANDLNKNVIDIFEGFKYASYTEYIEFLHRSEPGFIQGDKASYYKFRNYYNTLDAISIIERAFYQWVCIQCCINSMARWGKTGFNQGFGSRTYIEFTNQEFDDIRNVLNNTTMSNVSFFDMKHLDNENVIWFLDPPYVSNTLGSYSNEFDENIAKNFISTIRKFKGDVIYTDTLNPYNTELLNNPLWDCIELGKLWSTSVKSKARNTKGSEYLFANFEIKRSIMSSMI